MDKQTLGEYVTYLAIIAHSIPRDLRDADGEPLQAGMMQLLEDITTEFQLGRAAHLDAAGAPADVVPIQRTALKQLTEAAATINAALDGYSPDEVMP